MCFLSGQKDRSLIDNLIMIQHFNMSFTRCHSVSLAFYLMLLLLVDLSVEPGLVIDHDLSE